MSAAFTPGPWEAWRPSSEAECWSICDNEHSRLLAAVWPEALIEGALPAEANARLISAAPDLFDALDGWLEAVGPQAVTAARRKAAAALAKARGESA